MSLRLMRRPGTSQPLTHLWNALAWRTRFQRQGHSQMRPGYPRPGTRQPPTNGDTFVPGALGTIPRVEPWRRRLDARRSMALHSCRSSHGQFRFRRSGRALSVGIRIRGGLYLTRQTGDLPGHPWSREQSPPGYGLLTGARRTDRRGRWSWEPLPQSAGVLSPGPCPRLQCRHLGLRLASLFYRLLLIALQLALASTLYRYPPVVRWVSRQLPSGLMETIRRPQVDQQPSETLASRRLAEYR